MGQDISFQPTATGESYLVLGHNISGDQTQIGNIVSLNISLDPSLLSDNQMVRGNDLAINFTFEMNRSFTLRVPTNLTSL